MFHSVPNYFKKKQKLIFWNLFFFILVIYGFIVASQFLNYLKFSLETELGNLDPQAHWQGLVNLSNGKVLYRDYFFHYGYLNLLLRLPFFLLLGKTFFASIFNFMVVMPILGIILSILLGWQLLNGPSFLVYLIFLMIFGVNNTQQGFRHLIPELGLMLIMVGSNKNITRTILFGGFLIGISMWGDIAYPFATLFSVLIFYVIKIFSDHHINRVNLFVKIFSLPVIGGLLFLLYLIKNNTLSMFITFYTSFVRSLYHASPCNTPYPRLSDINLTNFFNVLPRLLHYAVPFTIGIMFLWVILNRKKVPNFPIIFAGLVYSGIVYYRNVNTPCDEYLGYGLTFFFLILSYLIFNIKITWFKKLLVIISIWFFCVSFYGDYLKNFVVTLPIFSKKPVSNRLYLPVAGVYLEANLAKEYSEIVNYIKSHSTSNDSVYDFPNGAFQLLSQRKPAVGVPSTYFFSFVPSLVDYTYNQLKDSKPRIIVVNKNMLFDSSLSEVGIGYAVQSSGDNLILGDIPNKVEEYIIENYYIVKKYPHAWILERRQTPIKATEIYIPLEKSTPSSIIPINAVQFSSNPNEYKVTQDFPAFIISSDSLSQTEFIKIPIKVDLGIIKTFSKFEIDVFEKTNYGNRHIINQIAWTDWQDVYAYIKKLPEDSHRNIVVQISDNKGFLLFGKPTQVTLGTPQLFIRNPQLHTDQ